MLMKPETADAIAAMQEEHRRVLAERDALARHIEALIAPVTREEVMAADGVYDNTNKLRPVLERFIASRQRAGQFKALG